jgi:PAS domain S-box-containing protein
MSNNVALTPRVSKAAKAVLAVALILCGSLFSSRYNYLLFHTLAELFSIVIGCGTFMLAWNSRQFLRNGYVLLLGISCLFVAAIDLVHALAYRGMPIFSDQGSNLATQLWIAARYTQSLSLLIAPLVLQRRLNAGAILLAYAIITSLLLFLVFGLKIFPNCYVEGVGLTQFKLLSEYAICAILVAAMILLLRRKEEFDPQILPWLMWSLVFTIASELTFTSYVSVYGAAITIGHCLKIFAFYCIYHAIIQTGLTKPFAMLLRGVKRSESALRLAKQRLDMAQSAGRIGTFYWDLASKRSIASDGMEMVYGETAGKLDGKYDSWRLRVHPEDLGRVEQLISDALAGRAVYETEYRIIWPDGSVHWVEARGNVQRDVAGKLVSMVGINMDITARKKAEDKLRQSEERFRAVQEVSPDGFTILRPVRDSQGRVIDFTWVFENDAIARMTRTDPTRVVGKNLLDVFPGYRNSQFLKSCAQVAETRERRVFEALFPEELMVEPTWLRVAVVPIGEDIGVLAQDITRHKDFENELQRLVTERTANLQEMVNELEHFSYSITHDMRAPLRAMKSYGELVLNELCADCQTQQTKDFLTRIITSADRMDALIRDALDYSRLVRQDLPLETVNSDALLRGMLSCYPELQPSKAHVQIEGALPLVLANQAGLTQCFSNLLGNAVKFVQPGKIPQVRIWSEHQDGWAAIYVEDKGIGIPKQMVPRVFDMFSRGHRGYEGTGIGLALVRKAMSRMGGKVGVESEEGKGSRFWLKLQTGGLLNQNKAEDF